MPKPFIALTVVLLACVGFSLTINSATEVAGKPATETPHDNRGTRVEQVKPKPADKTASSTAATGKPPSESRPNIVYIICDDLGYGDVQCLNPEHGKIPTPHMDRLASQGMTFTDSHSGSSVCSPTRYGLLTGRYSWRTRLQRGVVSGFQPCLIAEETPTVSGFLQEQGYHTAIIGKWHLDFQYLHPDTGAKLNGKEHKHTGPIGARIPDGPVHRGFDLFHGIHHARSMKAIINNDTVVEHDEVINFLPRCRQQCVDYIKSRADNEQPFFLFVPLGAPHTPIVPTTEWKGKSGLGDYGDFVMQTDDCIGEICKALQEYNLADDTLVICTSDNGCSRAAEIGKLAKQGHRVSAGMRGSKADIWDGGHRVPFFVRWPSHVEPGTTCEQTICHVDLFATIADIVQQPIPANSCQDSVSFLPALSGDTINSTRPAIIHHSISGHFAIRSGKWKLALAAGSGGWSKPNEKNVPADAPEAQLYDMSVDPGEQNNLYEAEPEIAERLLQQLKTSVYEGRSTEGPESKNDLPAEKIKLWKTVRNRP